MAAQDRQMVTHVPIEKLVRDPHQPRKSFDSAFLQRLANSMRERVEVPLKVRKGENHKLIIIDGEQRWRAAKIAKLTTLPCIIDEGGQQLDIAATQLTTSALRAALNPLDIAEFLVDLRSREKKTINELLAELAKRGITEIGHEKIERYLRLTELPAWAKDLMREGKLSESQGVALLAAVTPGGEFAGVLKIVKAEIARALRWKGGITLKEVQEDIERGFRSEGIDLNRRFGDEENIRAFPIEQCRACKFYKKIGGGEYCYNEKEFKKKQNAALTLKATKEAERAARQKKKKPESDVVETDPTKVEPRKVKLSSDNVVMLRRLDHRRYEAFERGAFDTTDCQACPHKHLASHDGTREAAEDHCFYPPCHATKTSAGQKMESRRGKLREYLERWLRPRVAKEIQTRLDTRQQDAIVLWLATGAIDRHSKWNSGQMHARAASSMLPFIADNGLKDLPAVIEFGTTEWFGADAGKHRAHMMKLAVRAFTREQVRWIAKLMKIDLNDPAAAFRIDDLYLAMKRKGELGELAKIAGLETIADLGVGELRAKLLDPAAVERIGVPADIEFIYQESYTDTEAEEEERELEEFDEDDLDIQEGPSCVGCGCSEMDACDGGCAWAGKAYIKGQERGVCTACPAAIKRWQAGKREFTPEALQRIKTRRAMIFGVDEEALASAALAEEDAPPARKRKRA